MERQFDSPLPATVRDNGELRSVVITIVEYQKKKKKNQNFFKKQELHILCPAEIFKIQFITTKKKKTIIISYYISLDTKIKHRMIICGEKSRAYHVDGTIVLVFTPF